MWIKAKVVKDIERSFAGHSLPEGTTVYVSKDENRVDLITLDGRINTIPVEKAKEHLEYVMLNGKYLVKDEYSLRKRFVRIWNSMVHQ